MKKLNFYLVALIIGCSAFIVSCSSKKVGFFNNSYPQYAAKKSVEIHTETLVPEMEAAINATPVVEKPQSTTVEKSIVKTSAKKRKKSGTKTEAASRPDSENAVVPVKKLSKEERKQLRQLIKNADDDSALMKVLLVILAVILPPLAVALVDGLRGPFWLDLLLTILFYLPGLIYALFRIFRQD